ncbi:MAG TPA: dihydrofolate reductase family protein [Flavisolibacter sp.]|nr:dihydrofolate reductase family protein [Flavisolibacter sp.]
MRKIILGLAISLDGYIEGPNGEYDWCFTDQDYGMADFFKRVDTSFMGRKSYELMERVGDAANFPSMKEYIFSNTLQTVKAGAELISGNIGTAVRKIKNEQGKDIWLFGGAGLTTSLMKLGLVDELWLSVHPILLRGGKRLFPDEGGRQPLKLLETKTYSTGLVSLKYEIERA